MIPPLPKELYLLFDLVTSIKESFSYLDSRRNEVLQLFILLLIVRIFISLLETLTNNNPRQGFFHTQQENPPMRNQLRILDEHGDTPFVPEAESNGLSN